MSGNEQLCSACGSAATQKDRYSDPGDPDEPPQGPTSMR